MNRARAYNAVLHTLLAALLMIAVSQYASAQINRARRGGAPISRADLSLIAPGGRAATRLVGGSNLTQVPKSVTKRYYKSRNGVTRVAGDNVAIRQTVLLTKLHPADQISAQPAPSQDEHPFATADEKYIYFDSDRADDTTSPQVPTGIFNIYRMFLDGSGVTKITSGNANKIEPAVSQDGSRVAYAAGGSYTNLATNLDNPTSNGFSLFYVDLSAGGNPVSLTLNNASGMSFADVRHPTWSSAGDKIAFAGRRDNDPTHYHIFIVDVQSVVITQMTSGASNDYSPSWSPDGRLVAYTTNASGFAVSAAPTAATGVNANDDIWVLNPNAFTPDAARVTQFTIAGKVSSNKNPAWSTLRFDPLNIASPEVDPNGNATTGPNLLAFASNRADTDVTQPGVATDVVGTFDIYWMRASIKPDPAVGGAYTVTTPESASPAGNHALKLRTSTADTAIDPTDPASMFDPNFQSNEDYPTWPQYINSYRIFYQSDHKFASVPAAELNILGSTIFDINAPSLLKFSIENNEIIHVGLDVPGVASTNIAAGRQFSAGQTLRLAARVVDYESGVESVYVQIKNPNSAPQSADATEHKTYFVGPGVFDGTTPVVAVNPPYELDYQAVNPSTGLYRKPGRQPVNLRRAFPGMPNNWPGWNMYIAGLDDNAAMSGINNPPDDDQHDFSATTYNDPEGGFWLRMWDDGPVSKGGHEPEGETAGDGIFTTTWQTPSDQPSDFYMDLIVRDNAIDPFNTPTDIRGINWKIYDNVWGFTTAPFIGRGNWLYVNDYDSGQRFFQAAFGPAPTLNTFFNGWGSESWNTEMDEALFPITAFSGTTALQIQNFLTPLGLHSYGGLGPFNNDPTVSVGPNGVPVTGAYDQWRILARGPLPDSVLNSYRAHVESQPPDVLAGGTGPNLVTVAERAIIWHSPYTGRLFVGPGTLSDNDTQVRIANFVRQGGRLFVHGQQVAYGLTLAQTGGGTSPFLNNTLHATYVNDFLTSPNDNLLSAIGGQGIHPIVSETWYTPNGPNHIYPAPPGPPPFDYPSSKAMYLGSTPSVGRSYMCLNNNGGFDNLVLFTAPINSPDKSDVDAFYGGGSVTTKPAIMWFTDTANAPLVSKVVFSPFGWEQINPEFVVVGTNLVMQNRRVEMYHNVGDYLRTGRIVGVVRSFNGGGPLNHVFLKAVSLNGTANGKTVSTTYSQADGSYTLNGLDANGLYNVTGFKAGFVAHTQFATLFHGGDQSRLDFPMTEAQPGTISGTVTLQIGGTPAPGLNVVAQSMTDPSQPVLTATTDVKGQYTIKNVPPDIYMVSLPPDSPGNRTALGYGASTPASYGYITTVVPAGWQSQGTTPPAGVIAPVQVGTNQGTTPYGTNPPGRDITLVDFQLKQAPGSISGTVTDKVTGQPISGATVVAANAVGSFSANTIANGTYTIPNVDPGTYTVTGSAPGYAAASVQGIIVTSGKETKPVDLQLSPVPPGGLSGLVATSNGTPIGGATVTVSKLDGTLLLTGNTGALQTEGTYQFNYRFSNDIPAGAKVLVNASKPGYTNKTGILTVGPINPGPTGPEIQGVNFTLDPLFTFPNQLTLVSSPYAYTTDVATLFGIPASDVNNKNFAFISWEPLRGQYIFYPTPPADTFHLGVGYFMQEVNSQFALSLTQPGTLAPLNSLNGTPAQPDYQTFPIQLQPGWNLIGDPFVYSLNFLTLQVQEQDGSIKDVLAAQSGQNPALGAALWTYENGNYQVVFTLDPFRGYWIRAFRPVKLLVVPTSQQTRATQSAVRTLMEGNAQGSGWKLNLVANVGDTRSAPAIIGVHPAATDNYDLFKLEAPPAATSRAVSLAFDHPDWAVKAGAYSVDVRSVATAQQKWSMNVSSNVSGEPVTLTWPTMATVPGKYDVMLTDEDSHTTIRMRTQSSYTIPSGKAAGPVTRHFTLSVQRAQRSLLSLTDVTAQIHGGGGRAAVSAEIGYNLTSSATVQVTVMRGGRVIRTLEQGNTRAAGVGQAVWDLRQADGTPAPADTYTVEVTAADSSGQKVRRLVPFVLTGR